MTPAEEVLAGIFTTVLQVDGVDPHDDFFRLGGNSIRVLQMVTLARAAGLPIDVDEAYSRPTVAGLAALVTCADRSPVERETLREVVLGARASPRRCHLVLTSGEDLAMAGILGERVAAHGVAVHVLMPLWHEDRPYVPAEELACQFAQHMVRSPGEFVVVGHCASGPLAARICCRLQDLGQRVRCLVLLDTDDPGPHVRSRGLERLIPIDPAAPRRLSGLRADLAHISRQRSQHALSPTEVMRRAWPVVSRDAAELLTLATKTDVTGWTTAALDEATRNYMAWLNLVVGLEESMTCRLADRTNVAVVVSAASVDRASLTRSQDHWQRLLGGSTRAFPAPGRHRGLLHCDQLVSLLSYSSVSPSGESRRAD